MKRSPKFYIWICKSLGIFFLIIFGLGLGNFIGPIGDINYLSYMAPGVIGMGLLFGSVFSGVSVIFDRQFGFMKEMMVAPVSRTSIIIGKIFAFTKGNFYHLEKIYLWFQTDIGC